MKLHFVGLLAAAPLLLGPVRSRMRADLFRPRRCTLTNSAGSSVGRETIVLDPAVRVP